MGEDVLLLLGKVFRIEEQKKRELEYVVLSLVWGW